jgi:hypothetical protein
LITLRLPTANEARGTVFEPFLTVTARLFCSIPAQSSLDHIPRGDEKRQEAPAVHTVNATTRAAQRGGLLNNEVW